MYRYTCLLLLVFALPACDRVLGLDDLSFEDDNDNDGGADADADGDGDTDSDGDTDTDADADADSDGDSGSEECPSYACDSTHYCDAQLCDWNYYYCTEIEAVWEWRMDGDCDDGNECTYGDRCVGGNCAGQPVTCSFTDCMQRYCNGTSTCTEIPMSDEISCGYLSCQSDYCVTLTYFDHPDSCLRFCDGAGTCGTCSCDPPSMTTCAVGPGNQCCMESCSMATGCGTVAGACTDVCGMNDLVVGRTCSGCGANLAEGACAGGSVGTCDALTHTQCQTVYCGGTFLHCTNDGGTWAWRENPGACDEEACFPLDGWGEVICVDVDNILGTSDLVDYQVLLQFDHETLVATGAAEEDGRDFRFTLPGNTVELPFWIEVGFNTECCSVWVRVPSVAAAAVRRICFHHGNPLASPESDPDGVFLLYDGFDGDTLDASKWTPLFDSHVDLAGGFATFYETSVEWGGGVDTAGKVEFAAPFIAEARFARSGSYEAEMRFRRTATNDVVWTGDSDYSSNTGFRVCRAGDNYGAAFYSATGSPTTDFKVYQGRLFQETWSVSRGDSLAGLDETSAIPLEVSSHGHTFYAALTLTSNAQNIVDWIRVRKHADPEPGVAFDSCTDSDTDADSDSDTDADADADADTDADADADTDADTDTAYKVLLLSPDYQITGPFTEPEATLSGYADLNVTIWNYVSGAPAVEALAGYCVVVIGNQNKWSLSSMGSEAVGNALAAYLDAGGTVLETAYVHDYYGWELSGAYITSGYSCFTSATTDSNVAQSMLVVDGSHALMSGVSTISINELMTNPGLAAGAASLSTWSPSGYNAVCVNSTGNVVGINAAVFNAPTWIGDMAALMHNAITWLCENN